MARGSIRESMQVKTASPLAAVPAIPESWNSDRYRLLASSRSSKMVRFYQQMVGEADR
jgi:hypothetical protein